MASQPSDGSNIRVGWSLLMRRQPSSYDRLKTNLILSSKMWGLSRILS